MRTKAILVCAAAAGALTLGGCTAHTRNNMLGGAGIGAAGGAGISAISGGDVLTGAAVGAGVGAAAGYIKGCNEDRSC